MPGLKFLVSDNPYGGQKFVFDDGSEVILSESLMRILGEPEVIVQEVKRIREKRQKESVQP